MIHKTPDELIENLREALGDFTDGTPAVRQLVNDIATGIHNGDEWHDDSLGDSAEISFWRPLKRI